MPFLEGALMEVLRHLLRFQEQGFQVVEMYLKRYHLYLLLEAIRERF